MAAHRPLHTTKGSKEAMYAILRQGNHQYRVAIGDRIEVPTIDAEAGSILTIVDVLAVRNGDDFHVGAPRVEGATVTAKVTRHGRGEKIRVFKYSRRKGYEKRRGHRQGFTELYIKSVSLDGADLT